MNKYHKSERTKIYNKFKVADINEIKVNQWFAIQEMIYFKDASGNYLRLLGECLLEEVDPVIVDSNYKEIKEINFLEPREFSFDSIQVYKK